MYIMNYTRSQPLEYTQQPTKNEIDTFFAGICMSSNTHIPEKTTQREDSKNYIYSNTNNILVEDRQTKKLTCDKHGIFEETIYNKYKFNLDDGCPECRKPKKLVSYRCGEGEERFIEEGSLSHRCPNCVWGGKKYTFVHLNQNSYC